MHGLMIPVYQFMVRSETILINVSIQEVEGEYLIIARYVDDLLINCSNKAMWMKTRAAGKSKQNEGFKRKPD